MRFLILLDKTQTGSGYFVQVPALPGCFSYGDTFDEALRQVKEAIQLHFEGMLEDGDELPGDGDFVVAHVDVQVPARVK